MRHEGRWRSLETSPPFHFSKGRPATVRDVEADAPEAALPEEKVYE